MNTKTVQTEIASCMAHLLALREELARGEIGPEDDPELAAQLSHILGHLSSLWNCKDLSPEQRALLPAERARRASLVVPNLLGQHALGEAAGTKKRVDQQSPP